MEGDNSTIYGLGFNRPYMCHTATVPCSCTNPMTRWYNNVLLNPNNLLNYQITPENTIYGFPHASNLVNPSFHVENNQEASEQMAINEIDSWLQSDPGNDQIDGSLNIRSYCSCCGNQYQGQFIQMQTQGFQASLLPMVAGIVPEATNTGTMDLPQEWPLNHFSFSPGNLIREGAVGTYSNSTSISSIGVQQLISPNDLQRPSEFPPMSRQDRILRYLEKKKARKYEKKIVNSRRKTYAQTRPRIRGRFAARSSQTGAQ
ncbi:hypothetical protein L1987_08488 [Smallanthus sonchifolius]|uniref:Uncharacterized protein n=1 Tax=Smallanthus sonchifolius TaxID=185202 RepID=A0ACB9JKT6_9ASTR|nr:hypothetical protein L1987_08488 [Smallanthus sonchifolius]